MSRLKLPILAGAALIAALAVTPMFAQQASQSAAPAAQQEAASPAAPADMNQPNYAQAFTGTIAKAGDKYVLKDAASHESYALDDQTRAKEFEGKSVKVSGKLDAQSKTIHVTAIEPA